MLKITKVDIGRCIIVYETQNTSKETIYYGLMDNHKVQFMRCSRPFKDYGEKVYEPQSEAWPKAMIEIELPKGSSPLEAKVKEYILNHPLMRGV